MGSYKVAFHSMINVFVTKVHLVYIDQMGFRRNIYDFATCQGIGIVCATLEGGYKTHSTTPTSCST